jgi:hypothetical protein
VSIGTCTVGTTRYSLASLDREHRLLEVIAGADVGRDVGALVAADHLHRLVGVDERAGEVGVARGLGDDLEHVAAVEHDDAGAVGRHAADPDPCARALVDGQHVGSADRGLGDDVGPLDCTNKGRPNRFTMACLLIETFNFARR